VLEIFCSNIKLNAAKKKSLMQRLKSFLFKQKENSNSNAAATDKSSDKSSDKTLKLQPKKTSSSSSKNSSKASSSFKPAAADAPKKALGARPVNTGTRADVYRF
jgi:hypothetical protein